MDQKNPNDNENQERYQDQSRSQGQGQGGQGGDSEGGLGSVKDNGERFQLRQGVGDAMKVLGTYATREEADKEYKSRHEERAKKLAEASLAHHDAITIVDTGVKPADPGVTEARDAAKTADQKAADERHKNLKNRPEDMSPEEARNMEQTGASVEGDARRNQDQQNQVRDEQAQQKK